MDNLEQKIKDKLTKVCVCRAITKHDIKESIRNGAKTIDQIAATTGATYGSCCGRRCKDKIEGLVEEYHEGEWQ